METARILAAGGIALAALGVAALGVTVPAQAQTGDAPVPGEGVVTARGGLAVRTAPTTHASGTGHLDHGDSVPVVCRIDGGIVDGDTTWYAVAPTDQEWVSGRHLDMAGPVPECGDVQSVTPAAASTALTVRRGPSTDDQAIGSLRRGQELWLQCAADSQQVDGDGGWYKLSRSQGWVAARYVDLVDLPPGPCTA